MLENKKVSIIVPLYNSEYYIERCIKSLLNQTWENIEIVCVDSGSTDRGIEKLKKFNSEKIKIYSNKNEGVSKARNYGIDKATGEFITFVDSDDYVDKGIIEELVSNITKESVLVICDTKVLENTREYKLNTFENNNGRISREDIFKEIVNGKCGLVCSKLVNRNIINKYNIRFDTNLKYGEDQLFFLNVAEKCDEYVYINKALYMYDRRNESAITNRYCEGLINNFMYLQNEIISVFEKNSFINIENKIILNKKLIHSIWKSLNNDVNNIRMCGVKKYLSNTQEILTKADKLLYKQAYVKNSKLEKVITKSVISRKKYIESIKLLILIKGFNFKNKLLNKG